jgi:hypothetical protein
MRLCGRLSRPGASEQCQLRVQLKALTCCLSGYNALRRVARSI